MSGKIPFTGKSPLEQFQWAWYDKSINDFSESSGWCRLAKKAITKEGRKNERYTA